MNKYRFKLGKTPDTTRNLVQDGTFASGLAFWSVNPSTLWTGVGGEARAAAPSDTVFSKYTLTQGGILTVGETYYLSYDLRKQSGTSGIVTPSIGGVYYDVVTGYDENTSASFVNQVHTNMLCSFGTDLVFFQGPTDPSAIDNVIVYPYVWNSPLTDEPVNWNKAKITKKRDEILNGLIINYIADLTFVGDGYDYLYAQYVANGYCGEVPIRIEIWNATTNIYELFYQGFIYINECEFNISNEQVNVNIRDSNASHIFGKSKGVKVNLFPEYYSASNVQKAIARDPASLDFTLTGPNPTVAIVANDNAGSYVGCDETLGFDVYQALRKIVLVSSGYKLDFDSTFFSSGTFDKFCFTTGYLIKNFSAQLSTWQISMEELFSELNKLFNLSFSINSTGPIPKVIIEPKVDYLNSTSVLSLSLVADVTLGFDKSNIVRSINTGYEYLDATATETGDNNPKGSQYKTSNLCAEKELNLVSRYIQDSTVIKNLFNGTITGNKYDNIFIWLETTATVFTACDALGYYQTRNSGSGTFDLNPNIDEADNVLRQIATLQTDFLKQTSLGDEVIVKPNAALTVIYSFDFPLTKAQFDLIAQAYNTIDFNRDGTGATTKKGYLVEAEFAIENGLTEFQLLST